MQYGETPAKLAKAALLDVVPEIKAMALNTNLRAEDRLNAAHLLIFMSTVNADEE